MSRLWNVLSGLSLVLAGWPVAAAAEPSFVPVYERNFPDPFVLTTKGGFIAYSTNDGLNLPMAESKDLVHWAPVTDPARPGKPLDGLPVLGAWAKKDSTWAPEVMRVGERYLLYYTAAHRKLDRQCVGVAVASDPRGPFVDTHAEPLVCQVDLGGTIDADAFRDADGKLYLYYKNDGNRVAKSSAIWAQQLGPDGMSLVGQPVAIERDSKGWQQKLVEAPTMVRVPSGGYQLFYSGGYYGWNADQRISPYAMGYANCTSALGPCKDAGNDPLLHSFNDRDAGCLSGPGHQSIFQAAGRTFIAFHAWAATKGCRKAEDQRYLYVAPIHWESGKPVLGMGLRDPAKH
jgi:beta-xylosidase